ncbi:hypothetical protein EMCRGX_G033780 [Ephydatia muelleri]|eukprot:Em0022g446a
MTLSEDEAYTFITDVLKLTDAREKLISNRVKFLDDLIKAHHSVVPFQNVTLLSQPIEERHVPTWNDIKAAVMGGYGGLCYTLAGFMKALLAALGYDVHFASGAIFYPNNHVTVIVNNLTFSGSLHMVDLSGYPTFEVIPLNFEKESPEYNHCFLRYKFMRADSSVIWRMHRMELELDRPLVPEHEYITPDGWRRVCVIDVTPREFSSFYDTMDILYTRPEINSSPFLKGYRAVWFPDLKLVAVKNFIFRIEHEQGKEDRRLINTQEEMIAIMSAHFPSILLPHVKRALDHLRMFVSST